MSTTASSISVTSGISYFATPDINQRIDLIKHLLANTSLIPFILASEGSGKTRFAEYLHPRVYELYTTCMLKAAEIGGIPDLRVMMARDAGMKIDQTITDAKLNQQLIQLSQQKKTFLLILDDIDQLSAEPLAWLVNFFTNESLLGKAKLVVLSSLDLLALPLSPLMINQARLRVQIMDIPGFSREQTKEFINLLGMDDQELVNPERLAGFFKETGGKPGKIIWQLNFLREQRKNLSQKPIATTKMGSSPMMVVGTILMLSLIGTALFFQDDINRFIESGEKETAEEIVSVPEKNNNLKLESEHPKEIKIIKLPEKPEKITEKASGITIQIDNSTNPVEAPPASQENEPTRIVAIPEKPEEQIVEPVQQAEQSAIESGKISTDEAFEEDKTATVKETLPVVPLIDKQSEAPAPAPAPVKQEKEPSGAAGYKSQKWLMGHKDTEYTLQLIAVSSQKGIMEFVEKHGLKGDMVILETVRDKKPWFSLLYGVYKNRDLALKGQKSLPSSLKSLQVWPRSLGSIRKALATN